MRKATSFIVSVLMYVIAILTTIALLFWVIDVVTRIYEALS